MFIKSTAELSKDYVRTSLNEFEDDPVFNSTFIIEVRTTQSDSPLARAYDAYEQCRYTEIPSLCTQELELSSSIYRLEALSLRGSFYLLMGNFKEALADFDALINDSNATEQVRESDQILFFSKWNLDENYRRIKTSEYENSSTRS